MPVFPLASIPSGSDVYVDANILVYAMLQQSPQCVSFVGRCGSDVYGYSDAKVLHDVMHKLMLADAGKNASHLKKNPALIKSLTKWQRLAGLAKGLSIEWLGFSEAEAARVPREAARQGLLCGDTLLTVFMADFGITAIATLDTDFADVGLTVYAPTDLKI